MAIPIKPEIISKTNFAIRPTVPITQKETAEEFNLLVNSVRANYERLVFDWDTDVANNSVLVVGQYVLYDTMLYQITTSYNVGSPATWIPANAQAVILTEYNIDGGVADSIYTTVPGLDGGPP